MQTKRTLNKILRFEGSGLWLRKREKGYLFIVLTISVTIELFAYTALQRLKINFHFILEKCNRLGMITVLPLRKWLVFYERT